MNKVNLKNWFINSAQTLTFITFILFIQSCSSLSPKKQQAQKVQKKTNSYISNFDRKKFPNDVLVISNMISIVQPELESNQRELIATNMGHALELYQVVPQIMVAIIDTESNFRNDKISSTGDLSLAQINVDVWNREFARIGRDPIDRAKLQTDQKYAMEKMAEILSLLKERYEHKDRKWYARYHSGTRQHKALYLRKLEVRLKMLAHSPLLNQKMLSESRVAQDH